MYNMSTKGMMEIWSTKDIQAGEEMFNDYGHDFTACGWYDDLANAHGVTPLSQLAPLVEQMYLSAKVEAEAERTMPLSSMPLAA